MGLIPISNWIIYWDACFLDLGIIFLDPYMYFGPGRIFFDLGAQKMWGTCLCVFLTRLGYFFLDLQWPACICAGPREFFYDRQINCFWPRFLLFGPLHLLCGPCVHRGEGEETPLLYALALTLGWMFLDLGTFFLDLYMLFWTWRRVGGI